VKIVGSVHAKKCYFFSQLWALGRAAYPDNLTEVGPHPYVAPSAISLSDRPTLIPRELTIAEIKQYIADYATAAHNAVFKASFDGVEIHAGNGYLLDQFIQDMSNQRRDEYGGSIENRCKIVLEVIDAVAQAVGQKRVGIRFSPWSPYQGETSSLHCHTALL
jgi:NADPH2 dehydrogenase